MHNRKKYIVKVNPKSKYSWDKYIIIPEGEEYDENTYYSSCETVVNAQERALEYNSKYYTSDYDANEIKDFFDSIDFKPLEDKINERLGTKLTFKKELKMSRGDWRVSFESNEDLCKLDSLLSKMLLSCKLGDFNSSLFADPKTGELKVWMTIHFSYEHFGHGTNGCELCAVWYNEKDGWKIIFEEDRYNKDK